jgi:hypothetical protein
VKKQQRVLSRIELIRRQRKMILRSLDEGTISFQEAVRQLHNIGFEVEVACSIVIHSMMRLT